VSTVRFFRHDDVGAPVLAGVAGSLVTLLRACLVGSGGIAYGGTPSAGWSESFAGSLPNVAVFRNSIAAGGCGCFVHVDDAGPGAAGAREARARVYANMTDIATGVSDTGVQFVRKSSALSSTARKWLLAADERTFWLYIWETGDSSSGWGDTSILGAGDYDAIDAGGIYRYFILGRITENISRAYIRALKSDGDDHAGLLTPERSGLGSAKQSRFLAPLTLTSNYGIGGEFYPSGPDPITGDKYVSMSPLMFSEGRVLGRARGIGLPLWNLQAEPRGEPLESAPELVCLATNNDTNQRTAAVALDVVGPWS
jgi:hypothetical protein